MVSAQVAGKPTGPCHAQQWTLLSALPSPLSLSPCTLGVLNPVAGDALQVQGLRTLRGGLLTAGGGGEAVPGTPGLVERQLLTPPGPLVRLSLVNAVLPGGRPLPLGLQGVLGLQESELLGDFSHFVLRSGPLEPFGGGGGGGSPGPHASCSTRSCLWSPACAGRCQGLHSHCLWLLLRPPQQVLLSPFYQ